MEKVTMGVIKTLAYFDLFDYPLTLHEIHRFLSVPAVNDSETGHAVKRLEEEGIIFRHETFYSLQNDPGLATRRITANKLANHFLEEGLKSAHKISSFPFVKSIMISGSLSKGYADEYSDVDFFIVTTPGRLWIARTLLAVYKRLFLFNSHKFFCINYFVDEQHLEISEHNMFTAIELGTLIPVYGYTHYQQLIASNSWIADFLPHFTPASLFAPEPATTKRKRYAEQVLNSFWPAGLDKLFRWITDNRWKRIYAHTHNETEFRQSFKSTPHVSTNHPKNYQVRILEKYEGRLRGYQQWTA